VLDKQRMKRLLFRLSVVVFSFLTGNGFGATSWGHWQHDNAHTGRTHAPVDPSSLALAWSAENYLRPLIVGDTLYARRLDGESTTVTAFSLTDGQVKWSYFGENIYFGYIQVAGDFLGLEGFWGELGVFGGGPSLGSAPVSYNPRRGDFYVKLDYSSEGVTRVRAFHYTSNDLIELLWIRTTPFNQFGGMIAIGSNDRLYAVGSGEIAIINPDNGSTITSIPFLSLMGARQP